MIKQSKPTFADLQLEIRHRKSCSLAPNPIFTSQTHSTKKGKGLMNWLYKLCPTALYSVVQSCCSILSHDTLHHCLSSNSNLELGYFFHYCKSCKSQHLPIFSWKYGTGNPVHLPNPIFTSQTHFHKKREGSDERTIQAVSHHTVQCGPIMLQYFVT